MSRQKAPASTRTPWKRPSPQMMDISELSQLPAMVTLEQFAWVIGKCAATARKVAEAEGILRGSDRSYFIAKEDVRLFVQGRYTAGALADVRAAALADVFRPEPRPEAAPEWSPRLVTGGR